MTVAVDPISAFTACGVTSGGVSKALAVDASGNLVLAADIDIDTTGLATSAAQTTGNNSLSSIDTKLSSQATAAKQDTLATAVGLLATSAKQDTLATAVGLLATSAKQDTLATAVAATNTAIAATNTALADGTQKVKTSLPTGTHLGADLSTSASSAAFTSIATTIGLIVVTALIANSAPVYLARSTSVTTSTGIELNPGDSITLPCANANEYFAISAATQHLRVLAL